jgi:nucleoside-diphosphate-sugar epimerase
MRGIEEDIRAVASLPYAWERLEGKSIVVSGGTGFLGQFLIQVIQYRNRAFGQHIRAVSLSRRAEERAEGEVVYLRRDVCESIALSGSVDYILHLASNTHPKQYEENPVGTITANIFGCYRLLELAREKKSRFLLASSVEIYGEGAGEPMDEQYGGYIDCNTYRAGYNEAKRVSESLCQSYIKQYGVDAVIARLSRCFGCDETKSDSKAIAQFFQKAVDGEDIILKSAGDQRFSYCYIADAVSGLFKIMLDGKCGEAYNIAEEDDGYTLRDYAEYIATLANVRCKVEMENSSAVSKSSYAVLSTEKLKELGWKTIYTTKEGMDRTYRLMLSGKKNH